MNDKSISMWFKTKMCKVLSFVTGDRIHARKSVFSRKVCSCSPGTNCLSRALCQNYSIAEKIHSEIKKKFNKPKIHSEILSQRASTKFAFSNFFQSFVTPFPSKALYVKIKMYQNFPLFHVINCLILIGSLFYVLLKYFYCSGFLSKLQLFFSISFIICFSSCIRLSAKVGGLFTQKFSQS